MTTVTISRDFGSEGDLLARKIADRLGYHFVDKEFIGALLEQYGFVEFEREYETLLGFWEKFDAQRGKRRESIVEMLNRVMEALAVHGNVVILGRSGFSALAGYADVFHIRFQAPFQSRVKRLMRTDNLTHIEAVTICEDNDRIRSEFVQNYYQIPWDSAHPFDLVINTDKIDTDLSLKIVTESINAYNKVSRIGKPTTGMIEVDQILMNAIKERLGCRFNHTENEPVLAMAV